jgi:hypothetical protein
MPTLGPVELICLVVPVVGGLAIAVVFLVLMVRVFIRGIDRRD